MKLAFYGSTSLLLEHCPNIHIDSHMDAGTSVDICLGPLAWAIGLVPLEPSKSAFHIVRLLIFPASEVGLPPWSSIHTYSPKLAELPSLEINPPVWDLSPVGVFWWGNEKPLPTRRTSHWPSWTVGA